MPERADDRLMAMYGPCPQCGAVRDVIVTADSEGRRAALVCMADVAHGPDIVIRVNEGQ